ncbi:MAG: ferrous iron transport protein A [Sedimentisphaerales bacterium]|jgi:ferrous iron transport protein A|nr:ferrous iron transport protein A [Sedimentisphaerales bacterium]NLZ04648.1 ferrous iron transport protein A [Phycisphaerae bacterium]HNY80700.1 ferrous iron transport protein A [Sedimentisphaerales bacterium]HOC64358.1 ferrous iron transport protein A [Sedimentisphaerales bacterium]HOH66679.1 ferrous iron transport protein A [Sedimentisphaerales bacterium]
MSQSIGVQEKQTRPLSTAKAGERVRLVRIDAGRGLNNRLASMGLVPNAELRVVSNGHPGPFVLIVKEAKVVLGRGVAQKILVK